MSVYPYLEWKLIKFSIITKNKPQYSISEFENIYKIIKKEEIKPEPECSLSDLYSLLGLSQREHKATQSEIRRSYRRISLIFHPDSVTEKSKKTEERYKSIQKAYDILKDPVKRKIYNNSFMFDNSIPIKKIISDEEFYYVYGRCFFRWSKWSIQHPVPIFGDSDMNLDDLNEFYDFWSSFKSSRDFTFMGKYNINEAEGRDERRWMEQKNKRQAKIEKKRETETIKMLVKNAQKRDPRWKKYQELLREKKENERMRKKQCRYLKKIKRYDLENKKKKIIQKHKDLLQKKKLKEKKKNKKKINQKKIMKVLFIKQTCKTVILKKYKDKCRSFTEFAKFDEWQQTKPIIFFDLTLIKFQKHKTIIKPLIFLFKISLLEIKKKEKKRKFNKIEEQAKLELDEKKIKYWTLKQLKILIKALKKFPKGTLYRLKKIFNYLDKKRTTREIICKIKEISNYPKKFELKKNINSLNKREELLRNNFNKNKGKHVQDWSIIQQQTLEQALHKFRILPVNERWKRIAESVKNKTQQECIDRFKLVRKKLIVLNKFLN